ncbi:hypothetical protein NDO41_07080 [Ectopseudomonas mendocina]|nr:hypothetical protein NDO41_07080 [Pseudomonas mendocina]
MRSGKKPVHLAMTGGKLPRQRMWEAIRTLAQSDVALTTYNVSRRSGEDDEAARSYLLSLAKAGIVEKLKVMGRDALWKLVKDEGAEAPRVNKQGKRLPPEAVECIWRALRILGELTAVEAASQAAAGGAPISENGARIYLQGLALAGYAVRSGGTPGTPASYRLLPARYSGPLHPIYQRCSYEQVYDPNLDKVVWAKGDQPDASELSGLRIENERLRKLLAELKTARPLVLYGDNWIKEIESALGEFAEVAV